MVTTPVDLFVFGNRKEPRRPRIGIDLIPDESGMIVGTSPPHQVGASTFGDPHLSGLTGHYYRLPAGTVLPDGVGIVADGSDVSHDSDFPPTHHTIYATIEIGVDLFIEQFMKLPWEYAGRI